MCEKEVSHPLEGYPRLMTPKTVRKPRGMAAKVSRAVQDLRQRWEKTTDPIEKARLGELLAMTDSSAKGEVFDDPMNQGENVRPIAKPRKF